MTKEEYLLKCEEDEDFAPGWDIIDNVFDTLYPGIDPAHFATDFTARAEFGGNSYLDGYSIYDSPKGYKHIVTYGMTELYGEPEAYGRKYNRWGYEMTFKLKEDDVQECMWALDMLDNLARYTYTSERFFEPLQYVGGNGSPIRVGADTKITGLLIIEDTEAQGLDTMIGRTDFLQLFGLTTEEVNYIKEDYDHIHTLIENIKKENPDFVTDLNRTKSYI